MAHLDLEFSSQVRDSLAGVSSCTPLAAPASSARALFLDVETLEGARLRVRLSASGADIVAAAPPSGAVTPPAVEGALTPPPPTPTPPPPPPEPPPPPLAPPTSAFDSLHSLLLSHSRRYGHWYLSAAAARALAAVRARDDDDAHGA